MGNCSPSATKTPSPETCRKNSSSKSAGNENNSKSIIDNKAHTCSSGKIITPNLKKFNFSEVKSATNNFRSDRVLDEGGTGTVYKGWVHQNTYEPSKVGLGIAVAVKKSKPDGFQGSKEWQIELELLGKFSHPNIIKLLGYCSEDKEYLHVYEYMPKGSLKNYLFKNGLDPLPWNMRLKIAMGAARALTFLHNLEQPVIYRDFKTSHILLDEAYNAKLSDFGLAKVHPKNFVDTHLSTRVMGTYGYAAPEYIATGHLSVKSDLYGFGVVFLEILTGLRVIDKNRAIEMQNLVDWAKPSLSNKRNLKKIMDPRLKGQYPPKGAYQAAQLVLKCLESDSRKRPSMEEVVKILEQINAIKEENNGGQSQPTE